MLLGISSYSDAEVPVALLALSLIACASLIFPYAFHKFACIPVSSGSRGEPFLTGHAVSSQGYYVVDSQKLKIVQLALDLFLCRAGAYDVWNCLYAVMGHDGSANRSLADTVAYKMPAECSVSLLPELELVPVACHVDVFRTEFHEWSDAFYQLILGHAS